MSRTPIEPLQASHAVEANQRDRARRTDVALAGDALVGFHNFVVGEVSPEQAPERIRHLLGGHPACFLNTLPAGSAEREQRCQLLNQRLQARHAERR